MELTIKNRQDLNAVLVALKGLKLEDGVQILEDGELSTESQLKDGESAEAVAVSYNTAILRHLAERKLPAGTPSGAPEFALGSFAETEQAQIEAWLEFANNDLAWSKAGLNGVSSAALAKLENHFMGRQFAVGGRVSIADIHLICVLVNRSLHKDSDINKLVFENPPKRDTHIERWYS
jgi:glutathione S-transferase